MLLLAANNMSTQTLLGFFLFPHFNIRFSLFWLWALAQKMSNLKIQCVVAETESIL